MQRLRYSHSTPNTQHADIYILPNRNCCHIWLYFRLDHTGGNCGVPITTSTGTVSDRTVPENVLENQISPTAGSTATSPSVVLRSERGAVSEDDPEWHQHAPENAAGHSAAEYVSGSCRESGKREQPTTSCTELENTPSGLLDTPEGTVPENSPEPNLASQNGPENGLNWRPAPLATVAAAGGGSANCIALSRSATDKLLPLSGGGDELDESGCAGPVDAENGPENGLGSCPTPHATTAAASACGGSGDANSTGLSRNATDILLQLSGVGIELDKSRYVGPVDAKNGPESGLGSCQTPHATTAASGGGGGGDNCTGLSRTATDILLQLSGGDGLGDSGHADPLNAGSLAPAPPPNFV